MHKKQQDGPWFGANNSTQLAKDKKNGNLLFKK